MSIEKLDNLTSNKYFRWGVSVLAITLLSAVFAWLGLAPPNVPVPPFPSMGWDEEMAASDQGVKPIAEALGIPRFQDTPAFRATQDPGDVFLWEACKRVTGKNLPGRNQGGVGSCVSFGTGSAIEYLMCVQIALANRNEEFRPLAQEVIYGGSRVQVGGGRIRGDGSVGAWAAQFVQKWGVVARGKYGSYDLSSYSESTCRQFGSKGCPKELETVARENPVKGITLVKTVDEAKKSLANGYPIAVCSNQGFSQTRDKDGFCQARGSWAHCMCLTGYRQSGGRKGFFVLNSWGESYFSGPVGLGDPSPAGFWAEEPVVNRMLSQGDSWAFSDLKGFPGRKLDWFLFRGLPHKHFALGGSFNASAHDGGFGNLLRGLRLRESGRGEVLRPSQSILRLRHGDQVAPRAAEPAGPRGKRVVPSDPVLDLAG